ncbi:DUF2461 domain-containing protein [Pedobacter hiemivivus]|uniref:DUF2461 domain-containing protein n=1 Tax=Pedobacter hiemivivus TaxID=2530454 RepID=A0A4R0N8T4_9SPHI|nr:DUF2461 domain-containing protein [Pedobacter hiemivivus]TCC94644.1 DUF2461 domain-containing protein [Pedobacter hiemivivus]
MAQSPTKQTQLFPSNFAFLNKLKNHNDRDWFNANKEEFQDEQQMVTAFAEALLQELNTHDVIETPSGAKSVYRIYRDTRFSKDKTPYKTYWSGSFKRATKYRRGGYYFHIEPGNSFIGGGFWGPNADDLKLIREDISFDSAPMRKILNSESFISSFEKLKGEQLKTTPKGFDANSEAIDLLRYKQFLLIRKFSDEAVLSSGFLKEASQTFKDMRPFLDYMSEVLTTDINGLSI